MSPLAIIIFLLILTVAVIVHELAHYLNARSVGLRVKAFSVGMGPVIARYRWRGTEWRLSLLPIGGYVDIDGMMPEQQSDGSLNYPTQGFMSKSVWQKLWVLVGGVLANFILAVVLVATVITADPLYRIDVSGIDVPFATEIARVIPDSTAATLGVEVGDRVLAVNGLENPTPEEIISAIQEDDALNFVMLRDGETLNVETPWPPVSFVDEERPLFGIAPMMVPMETPATVSFPNALVESTRFLFSVVPESIQGFMRAFGGAFTGQRSEDVAGPVRMLGIVDQAASVGLLPVLFFAGLINFSLALFNLLPIPALDGGRMVLAIVVALRGRPFKPGQEEFVHFVGFVTLMAFIVLITFGEIGDLFR